ncbi:MAG: polysaccharide pyruvyl transferase family protein, partial [Synergistaceae bacterium]|nr:polysaccharide pyruvyl transferase family protein [Synergistaceae bacterium]
KEQRQRTKTKNICLITWYYTYNYGTTLQCYSLVRFLKSHGYNVFRPAPLVFQSYPKLIAAILRKIKRFFLKSQSAKEKALSKMPEAIQEGYRIRRKKNRDLVCKELPRCKVYSRRGYEDMIESMDIFMVGSDQMWNPSPNLFNVHNLLDFVPDHKRKISYGTSIGWKRIPEEKEEFYRKYIPRFYRIGVRERNAENELTRIAGKLSIQTVLDPSFLMTRKDFDEITSEVCIPALEGKRYIFCYVLGTKNTTWMHDVEVFSGKENMPAFCALTDAVNESYVPPSCCVPLPDIGLPEFIKCIMNAEYIVTDSFHATALSINLNKKFAVYRRFDDDTRLTDLLNTFNLESRFEFNHGDNHELEFIREEIDYASVNEIKNNLRNESIKFLLDSIEM